MRHALHTYRRIARVVPLLLAAGMVLTACGTGTPPVAKQATISPETFISTYVDLRLAVLRENPGKMDDSIRSAILARHGVTAQQLTDFAKVHGSDVAYMRSVWEKIQTRLQDARPNPPSASESQTRTDSSRQAPDGPRGRAPNGKAGQMPPDGPPGRGSASQAGGKRQSDGQRVPPAH